MQEPREIGDRDLYEKAKQQLMELTKQQQERTQLERLGTEDPTLIGRLD